MSVRYEQLNWQLTTKACDELMRLLTPADQYDPEICDELVNCRNELRARLQRKDADPHASLNQELSCDSWLTQ